MDASAITGGPTGLTQVLLQVPPIFLWFLGAGLGIFMALISYIWVDHKRQVSATAARIAQESQAREEHKEAMQERFERMEARLTQALESMTAKISQTREEYVPRIELQRAVAEIAAGQARIETVISALAKSFRHDRLNTLHRLVVLEAKAGIEGKSHGRDSEEHA